MIVVCHSGARAALAAATLADMGYPDVAVLEGGLAAWTAAGLPVTEHEYAGI
jgi:rhodanese-related sulfurtransferase